SVVEPGNIGGSAAKATRITPAESGVRMLRYMVSSRAGGIFKNNTLIGVGSHAQGSNRDLGPSDRRFALEQDAVEVAPLVHVVIGIGLVHDAAVVPQDPVARAPLVTIFVFFLSG